MKLSFHVRIESYRASTLSNRLDLNADNENKTIQTLNQIEGTILMGLIRFISSFKETCA